MSAYFQNLLLPGADPTAVGDALCQWHEANGYTRETGRLLFDYEFQTHEERIFVISNEKGCVLLHNNSFEEEQKLFGALATFPALVQLWARDGRWGYELQEHGKSTASYISKPSLEERWKANLSVSENHNRLAEVCGVRDMSALKRIQKSHTLFLQKKCGKFADALGVPLAIYRSFGYLDSVNAGITEPRQIMGWRCQLLCFKKIQPPPKPEPSIPLGANLTPEQRERFMQRAKKRSRLMRVLWYPLSLIFGLVMILFMAGLFLLAFLCQVPFLRKLFLGRATGVCDDFLTNMRKLEPHPVRIEGVRAINIRHGCSIVAAKPAVVRPDFSPHKGPPIELPIFEIKLGKQFMSCGAHPPGKGCVRSGLEILETRTLSASGLNVQFQKRRFSRPANKPPRIYYSWELETPRAVYCFSSISQGEMKPADLELFENIVLSFKV